MRRLADAFGPFRSIHGRRITVPVLDVGRSLHRLGDTAHYRMEAGFDPLFGVGSKRADRPFERRLLGYGVVAGPGPDLAYGQHCGAERVDVPAHDRLQAVDDLVGHDYGVDRLVGFARVSALTLDRYLEAVGGARHRAPAHAHLPRWQLGPHVLREDDVRRMLPEHALFHHPQRPTGGRSLLRGLEQEEHPAG